MRTSEKRDLLALPSEKSSPYVSCGPVLKKGFSLVELMIVMAIVTILAALAIGGYGVARRVARLDIAADSLVSAFRDAQVMAKTGRRAVSGVNAIPGGAGDIGGADSSQCYGILLQAGEGEESVAEYIAAPYYPVFGNDKADYCDLSAAERKPLDLVEKFEIRSVESLETPVPGELLVLLKPPGGNLVLGTMTSVRPVDTVTGEPAVIITLGLPGLEETRTVRFHLVTGVAERVYDTK